MRDKNTSPIDIITEPIQQFIKLEKAGGIVLGISVILAMFLANSPWSEQYFHIFEHKLGLQIDGKSFLNYSVHHWINDGLMSIFFFVLGLELKKEIMGGELANPRKALLPIGAALGGVFFPAVIYLVLNPSGVAHSGWGIPMATDIAFALGVLYLLGKKIPLSLKVFLTALAIVDDLVAVLVIAFFYTSEISFLSLLFGLGCVLIMFIGNRLGIRNIFFYAFFGIAGVWIAFLLSGVHATIAAVLAAFTIPSDMKIKENDYIIKIQGILQSFKNEDPDNDMPNLTHHQIHLIEEAKKSTKKIIPPLQRLEHNMHPFVTFLIIPIFAFANAGLSLDVNFKELFSTNITIGVTLGLLVGKVLGIMGVTLLLVKLKVAPFPKGMNVRNLFGLSLLAAIGFTMSLFITSLAFTNEVHIVQAKIGVFVASLIGGIFGFIILNKKSEEKQE